MAMIRIVLADDQTIIREGLCSILESYEDMDVVGQASNGREAYDMVMRFKPDIVLMDIRMPVMDGVEATRIIKRDLPEAKVIILTTFEDDDYIINAMTFGASGYLPKDIGSKKLIEAIRDGYSGSIILPGKIASKITSLLAHNKSEQVELSDFSQREQDIIRLLVDGCNNKEIAEQLYLTVGTVKNYITQIYSKIGANDRANAVIFFKKLGL